MLRVLWTVFPSDSLESVFSHDPEEAEMAMCVPRRPETQPGLQAISLHPPRVEATLRSVVALAGIS